MGRFAVTFFKDVFAATKNEQELDLESLAALIRRTSSPTKDALPWLKLARFGPLPTEKGCLRWDGNMQSAAGGEGDYDGERMPFAEAVEILEKAGLRSLIYTSPSYTPEKPRWRVLMPTSRELLPWQRYQMISRLNGLLGGILAPESWTLSQSYYYGSLDGNYDHQVAVIEGTPIDELDELDLIAIDKPDDKPKTHSNGFDHGVGEGTEKSTTQERLDEMAGYDVEAAIREIQACPHKGGGWHLKVRFLVDHLLGAGYHRTVILSMAESLTVGQWTAADTRKTILELIDSAIAKGFGPAEEEKPRERAEEENFEPPPPKSFAKKDSNIIMNTEHKPLRWTIPDYVPEGLSILAGRQKLGKTWLAIDFAVAVALGGSAMGSLPCSQGDVLYIDLENGERRIKRRLETFFPDKRQRPDLSRLQWVTASPALGNDFIQSCEEWRQSVAAPALIVVDVLQRIKPAGSVARNSYENDYAALSAIQQWAMESGVSVLLLHHTRKGGADDPLEALSGSNGLSACADVTQVLNRTAAGITLYVRGRDVEERDTALEFDCGRFTVLGDAAEVQRSDERTRVIILLRNASEPMTPGEIARSLGAKPNNIRVLLFKMGKDGEVRKLPGLSQYVHHSRRDLYESGNPQNTGNTGNDSPNL
jgi:AAA domain